MQRNLITAFIIIFIAVIFAAGSFAQGGSETINLKQGFNFISFTLAPDITPDKLKQDYPLLVEDIYLYSAAAGSFLSLSEGTLTSLSAGKGYIVKASTEGAIIVSGAAITALPDAQLKTGFNLIGVSQSVSANTFSGLMKSFGIIKGLYKWSPAAGSFLQVVMDSTGTPQLLDSVDPQFKAGESYFINVYDNTTLSFSGSSLSLIGGTVPIKPVTPVAQDVPISVLSDIPFAEQSSGYGDIEGEIAASGLSGAGAPGGPDRSIAIVSLSNIKVWIKNHPEINTVTDENGKFTLKNVPAAAKGSGHTIEYEKIEGEQKYKGIVKDVPVVEKKKIDLKPYIGPAVIKKTGVIQGRIALADGLSPLGSEVYISGVSDLFAKVDEDGSFSLLYVPEGTFTLVFSANGYEMFKINVTVNADEFKQLDRITLKKIIQSSTSCSIDGYIFDESNIPLAAAQVSLVSQDGSTDIGTVTTTAGHYEFKNIKAASYKLVFIKDGHDGVEESVTLAGGEEKHLNKNLKKNKNGSGRGLIGGYVKDFKTGAPLRNAVIFTVPPTQQYFSDSNGAFAFYVTPGSYTVKVNKAGYKEERITMSVAEDIAAELAVELENIEDSSSAASLSLNFDQLIMKQGSSVQFVPTLKDAAGNIIAGKTITWSCSDTAVGTITSYGQFTAGAPGTCKITAASGTISAVIDITVTPDSNGIKILKLYPEKLTMSVDEKKKFTLVAFLEDGQIRVIWPENASWQVPEGLKAAVSEPGAFIGVKTGSYQLSASIGSIMASSEVTITENTLIDYLPPQISHRAPAVEDGKDVSVIAYVKDNTGVSKVSINYRGIGETAYLQSLMTAGAEGAYSFLFPAQYVSVGIEYYIRAEDTKTPTPNVAIFPFNGDLTPIKLYTPQLSLISLSRTIDNVLYNGSYDLSAISVMAKYAEGTTALITPKWTIKSGGGALSGSTFTPVTGATGEIVLTASYTENAITKTADLKLIITSAPKVLKPVINPATLTFGSSHTVGISCETLGAAIYYTLDGSAPGVSAKLYNGPFILNATTTVKAIAVKAGLDNSDVTSVTYTRMAAQVNWMTDFNAAKKLAESSGKKLFVDFYGAWSFWCIEMDYKTFSNQLVSDMLNKNYICVRLDDSLSINQPILTQYSINTPPAYIIFGAPGMDIIERIEGFINSEDLLVKLQAGLTAKPKAAKPVISPAAGTFTSAQQISITTTTPDAAIKYTLDGSEPSAAAGSAYTAPFMLNSSATVKAAAIKSGMNDSDIASAAYNIQTLNSTQTASVMLKSTVPAAINMLFESSTAEFDNYYSIPPHWKITQIGGSMQFTFAGRHFFKFHALGSTIDGVSYCRVRIEINNAVYWADKFIEKDWIYHIIPPQAFTDGQNTVKITLIGTTHFWMDEALVNDEVTQIEKAAIPVMTPAAGTYSTAQSVTLTCATVGADIYYTLDGTTPTTASAKYASPITIEQTKTLKAIAVKAGMNNSDAASALYTIDYQQARKLIAHWSFDNSDARDDSGNGHNGTIYGAPAVVTGVKGKAMKFSGSNSQYIKTADKRFMEGCYEVTISAWVNLASGNWLRQVLFTGDSRSGLDPISTQFRYNKMYDYGFEDISAAKKIKLNLSDNNFTFDYNKWYLLTTVLKPDGAGSKMMIYVDGVPIHAVLSAEKIAIGYDKDMELAIGNVSAVYDQPWNGMLDEIMVYNYALTQAEIQAYYGQTTPVATPVLSLAAGTYVGTQKVYISCATTGATLKYTLDGTTPGASNGLALPGAGTVEVTASATLKVIAIKTGMADSEIVSAAYTINQPIVNKRVGYWSFDNGDARDDSGNGNNGTVTNAALTTDRFGVQGKAYTFNGTIGSRIVVTGGGVTGNSPRSVLCWMKTTYADRLPFSLGYTTLTYDACVNREFAIGANTSVWAVYGQRSPYDESVAVSKNVIDGNWHLVGITYDGVSTLKCYADGVLIGTKVRDAAKFYDTFPGLFIGGWCNPDRYFNGAVDEVSVYNYALTDAEIQQNYNESKPSSPYVNNPNGDWTYGWSSTLGGTFTKYLYYKILNGLEGWYPSDTVGYPLITFNNTSSPIAYPGAPNVVLPADGMSMHPGPGGQYAILRWTVPATGTYNIKNTFSDLDTLYHTSTDVGVYYKNVKIHHDYINLNGKGATAIFERKLYLTAGETIDFFVGYGNSNYTGDTTLVKPEITFMGAANTVYTKVLNSANNHNYAIIDARMTWKEAKAYCESLGGYLATVTSQAENDFISAMVRNTGKSCWLGATDEGSEGTWRWITNEPFVYNAWGVGEPNNSWYDSRPENFLQYLRIANYTWNDMPDINNTGRPDYDSVICCEWGTPEPAQVLTPQFSVPAGTYNSTQHVALTCETDGAAIKYTVDGTTPSATTGLTYSGTIEVSTSKTIKAIAIKAGMTDSAVVNAAYVIQANTASGKIYFTSDRSGVTEIYSAEPDGTNQSLFMKAIGNGIGQFVISPDGTKISFVTPSLSNSNYGDLYVMNVDGSNILNLTNRPSLYGTYQCWSPDSHKLAFSANWTGNYQIYSVNVDGSDLKRISNTSADEGDPSWSPDGTKILFHTSTDIFVMNTDGSNRARLTTTGGQAASWSPDGTKIAFNSNRSGNWEIFVMNADGSNQTRMTNTTAKNIWPFWSPNGTKITFQSNRTGNEEAFVMNADGSNQTNVSNNAAYDQTPTWGPYIPAPVLKVSNPIFSVAGGTYVSVQNVLLSCNIPGATLKYTTDGSTPSATNGLTYSGTIEVSATKTIKAIAIKSGMTDSAVVSATYTINLDSVSLPYIEPFTSDPGWITNNPSKFYWDQTGGRYHYILTDATGEYAYKKINYGGNSFDLKFDLLPTRTGWASNNVFMLTDPDMQSMISGTANCIVVQFEYEDSGRWIYLQSWDSAGTYKGINFKPFADNINYNCQLTYNKTQNSLNLVVKNKANNSLICNLSLTGLGTFNNIDRMALSIVGDNGYPGVYAEGFIDNIEMSEGTILKTLDGITLSKTADTQLVSNNYDLSKISSYASYSDGTTQSVNLVWSLVSGGGTLSGTTYTAPAANANVLLRATYIEGGITKTADLTLNIINYVESSTFDGRDQHTQLEDSINGKIYVIGGRSTLIEPTATTSVTIYDVNTQKWMTYFNVLPYGHRVASATMADNGKIYITPGLGPTDNNGWGTHQKMIEFNPATMAAVEKASFGGNIWSTSISKAPNGKLYLFGGWNGGGIRTIWRYDYLNDTLTAIGNLAGVGRGSIMSVTSADGKIYLFGGNQAGGSQIEIFDPVNETITLSTATIPDTYIANRIVFKGLNNKIYVTGNDGLAFYEYSSTNNTLRAIPYKLTSPQSWATATSDLNNAKAYIIGGVTQQKTVTVVDLNTISPPQYTISFPYKLVEIVTDRTFEVGVTVKDGSGNIVNNPSLSWVSNNTSVFTVNSTGVITGGNNPSTTIEQPLYGTLEVTCNGSKGYLPIRLFGKQGVLTLKMNSGTLNSNALNVASPVVTVAPGGAITGSVSLTSHNTMVASSVFPVGYTWTWGDRQTAINTINGWGPVGDASYNAAINLTAPATPGTYYIFFGAGGEMNCADTMSLTNWSAPNIWNDGNDIIEWGEARYNEVNTYGYATTPYDSANGFHFITTNVASCAIKVVVAPQHTVTVPYSFIDVAVGRSYDIKATVKDAAGNIVANPPLTWTIQNTAVASVNSAGKVTGVSSTSSTNSFEYLQTTLEVSYNYAKTLVPVKVFNSQNLFKINFTSGSLNSKPISDSSTEITVAPGAQITGTINLGVYNPCPSGWVFPVGYTPTWGTRTSSYVTVSSWAPVGNSNFSTNINLTAPTTPGTYYIFFASGDEMNCGDIMSLTRWTTADVWNDGNDIADWKEEKYIEATTYKNAHIELSDLGTRYVTCWCGVNAIKVVVLPNNLNIDLGGGVMLEMIKIPAGNFTMGSREEYPYRTADELPPHPVSISKDFYIGKYEITQAQWLKIYGSWPGTAPTTTYGVGDNYPAYYVSWDDICGAGGFLEKINLSSPGGHNGFRLPTEAEWEYACRAGTQTIRYWGDDTANVEMVKYCWYDANSGLKTNIVGQKLPNAFGLYDMNGNVWEWCSDWYSSVYYSSSPIIDPKGPSGGTQRVYRGNGWYSDYSSSSTDRNKGASNVRGYFYGFRVVLNTN